VGLFVWRAGELSDIELRRGRSSKEKVKQEGRLGKEEVNEVLEAIYTEVHHRNNVIE